MNLLIEEDRYTGNISRKIIKSFFTMFCGYLSFLIIAILSGAQIYFQSISIGELSKEDDDDDKDKNAYSQRIIIYCFFVFVFSLIGFCRSIIFAFLSRRMSVKLHYDIIFRILRGSFPKFFNVVTNGRLINRLSSDIYMVDGVLP